MKMQSDCLKEACFNTCCTTNPPSSPPAAASSTPRREFVAAVHSTITPATNYTNHESLPSSTELLSALEKALPNYSNTLLADTIRAQHYHHLNVHNHVCLDYVGHGLFSYSQRQATLPFFELSYTSVSFTSYLLYGGNETELEAYTKSRILKYMNLLEEDYSLVFTANQSSAFKLLADSYPFHSNQNLLTVYDYENEAVETMVDAARKRGGRPHTAVFTWPGFRVDSRKLKRIVVNKKKTKKNNRGLFVFPLISRMTGSRYSYQWLNLARENGWHVLLDASALAAKEMETLGLSLFHPDFLICSFFNVFGHNPSGFCCLFVKKSSVSILDKDSASMGVASLIPYTHNNSDLKTTPSSSSEITELGNDVVEMECFRGLDHADELGLILISTRLRYLINWLINALLSLRHPNSGLALITVYGPRVRLDRGPAVAFNVYDWKGEIVEPVLVQKLADRNNISLSVGFLKNMHFSEDKEKMKMKKKKKGDCSVGVVSASLGMVSSFEDVYRVWAFVSRFLDADFVEKEKWRYTALNQTTVEV